MPFEADKDYEARLAGIVHELDRQREALRLLGLKQCSCCAKYYAGQEGKNLLDAGQLVCRRCVQDWWRQCSPTLDSKQLTKSNSRLWLPVNSATELGRGPAATNAIHATVAGLYGSSS
jgi:hypothetical protein